MVDKIDFFEDMAMALDSWTKAATESITNKNADLLWTDDAESFQNLQKAIDDAGIDNKTIHQIFSECFRGLTVSFLTILDGGTELAEKGRIYLVNNKGTQLGEGLHDEFVSHLIDSGRLE